MFIILHNFSYMICLTAKSLSGMMIRGFSPACKGGSHCVLLKIVICGMRCTVDWHLRGGALCSVYWGDYCICRVDVGICLGRCGAFGHFCMSQTTNISELLIPALLTALQTHTVLQSNRRESVLSSMWDGVSSDDLFLQMRAFIHEQSLVWGLSSYY